MAFRDRFEPETNLLLVTFDGTLSDEDLLEYARHALESADVSAGHDELIDLRGLEDGGEISTRALRRIADMFTRSDTAPDRSRVAMVATTDVHYGLSRMYQAFRSDSPLDLRVFRDMGEARAWLGLPPE
ncbi:MAG TPA: STAS/SEC14 domain-containing protein [Myxococcota bacterium]|nr:STAS/SEC14 domain-containing protein [Myxococcota bacterium]